MSKLYDKYIKEDVLENEYSPLEQEVDKMIFDIYGISSKEKNLISDFIDVSKPLMIKSYKSAFRSIQKVESENYLQTLCSEMNEFLEGQTLFVTGTTYSVNKFSPLAMVKLSFVNGKQEIKTSKENLDKKLWAEKAGNIYFRKKMNYYDGNDIYIIRPNQHRFWTRTMAMEDASELILEILNGD